MSDKPTPSSVSQRYLHECHRHSDGKGFQPTLIFWREECFRWNGCSWEPISIRRLETRISSWLQGPAELGNWCRRNFIGDMVMSLRGLTSIPDSTSPGTMLTDDRVDVREYITLENGLLDVSSFIAGDDNFLRPSTPAYFSLCHLPVEFDPSCQCPIWKQFCEDTFPHVEHEHLLQEWIGLNLVFDTSHEKMMFFIGQGANGKTVVCVVLRTLLGLRNVSAVGLEGFSPTRTFPLSNTIYKLANIVGEIGEVTRVSEGLLKQFVSAELMTIERKGQDPFVHIPTARLTFATNELPRILDRSDGIWRRMIVLPFTEKILDESKQDKRFRSSEFWKSNGELSGIFNWALEGLSRLRKRNRFEIPPESKACIQQYRLEHNPAAMFFDEHCEIEVPEDEIIASALGKKPPRIKTTSLHGLYRDWAQEGGYRPLSAQQFSKEVVRHFPGIEKIHPAAKSDGSRPRYWVGLKCHYRPKNREGRKGRN